MDQITVAAGSAATLEIIAAGSPIVVLATFTLNNPIAGSATGVDGILTLSGFPKTVAASNTGTAAFARIRTGGGVDVVFNMTVGTSSAHDVQLSSTSITSGQNITLNSAYIQHADIIAPIIVPGLATGTNLAGMEDINWFATVSGPPPAATLANIQDRFSSLNTSTWDEVNVGGAGFDTAVVSDQLEQSIGSAVGYTTVFNDAGLANTIIGTAVYVKLVNPLQGTWGGYFGGSTLQISGGGTLILTVTTDPYIQCYYNNGAGNVYINGTNYNSTSHKWLRIRESSGTIYFEAAPDDATGKLPGTFSTIGTLPTSTITWDLNDCLIELATSRGVVGGTYTGPARWDGLNTAVDSIIPIGGGASVLQATRGDAFTLQNLGQTAPRDEDISYLAAQNFYRNRLPIRWELLQPILADSPASLLVRNAYVPAIASNGSLYTNYRDRITSVLDAHAAVGAKCIIGLKNGCRYIDFVYDGSGNVLNLVAGSADGSRQPYTVSGLGVERVFGDVGGSALIQSNFVDIWSRIAGYWGVNWNGTGLPHPGLGGYSLMDQAYDLGGSPQSLTIWPAYAAAAIAGIRQVDPTTPIYICGNDHSYAANWSTKNTSFPLAGTNLVYEARQFLDYPGTGYGYNWTHEASNGATTSTGVTGVTNFVTWCESNAVKGAISETALPLDGTSDANQGNWNTSFTNMVNYLIAHNIEFYTWAGGNHWRWHGAPTNHVPQFYQDKPLEPLVGGLVKKAYGVAKATLYDSGASYWDPAGSTGGGGDALKIGVNIHSGWTSAGTNQAVADMMNNRNIRHARMDMFWDQGQTWNRDFIQRLRTYGGDVEMALQISYQWDHTIYSGGQLATIEADAYNEAYGAVDQLKDIVYDWELLNEITLREEMIPQVSPNSGQDESAYTGKTAFISIAAVLRGMADAIHDLKASSGFPLRVILGTVGRDYGFLEYMETLGVEFDVVGWHHYSANAHTLITTDTWFGTGGPMTQFNTRFPTKPLVMNEFNGAEIYGPNSGFGPYNDVEGDTGSENSYAALAKHGTGLWDQTTANLESFTIYELFNENSKLDPPNYAPEAHFGLFYDFPDGGLNAPKISLYVATALAGGTLSTAERNELITERSLFTGSKIDAIKAAAGNQGGGGSSSPLTITVGARGNITSNITISVSSDAGGTFTGTPVTLTAGANPTATFTFKPAGPDLATTLTYAITSGGQVGMQAPPPRTIYSYASPVALAATNLPAAGKTLLAKYNAGVWEASKGYTDYETVPAVIAGSGQAIRAICDSIKGADSTAKSPLEMINWTNQDNNYGSHNLPTRLSVGGKPYMWFNTNTFPMWMRKSVPTANIDPNPMNKMPYHLGDPHFMVAIVGIESGGQGTVMEASNSDLAGNVSRLDITSSGQPRITIGPTVITGSAMVVNQAYALSLVSKTGGSGQRLRVNNVEIGTPGSAALGTNKFNQLMIGGGHSAFIPTFSTKLRVFAAASGAGNPSPNELTVIENYLSTLGASGTGQPSGGGVPFGSRADGPYFYGGTISNKTTGQMDTWIKNKYDAWKAARVVNVSAISGAKAIQVNQEPGSNPNNTLCFSEGIGYGMLIAVVMAGYDSGAQTLFDGLLKLARTRYAYSLVNLSGQPKGVYLMEWRLSNNGASSDGGGWNAMDGDLDIALALLMAHRQWGSSGTWNYLVEAQNTISALKTINFKADGTTMGLSTPNVSRVSDYMFGHFRSFGQHTNDNAFWVTNAVARAYFLANRMQTVYSASAGLVPDFIVETNTATPYPSPGFMGDGNEHEDEYWWNSNRCPWRWASDYLWSGDANVLTLINRISAFINTQSSGGTTINPNLHSGYYLDGNYVFNDWPNPAFVGPWGAGAMCNTTSYQTLANSCWAWVESQTQTGYYDTEIALLSAIVMSGNWWRP